MNQAPAFIAFTGVDSVALIDGLRELSARYPIEWGVLIDDAQTEQPLFPETSVREALLAVRELRWAAHVCGEQARLIANAPERVSQDLGGYQRVQVNHGFEGSGQAQVRNVSRFGRGLGVRSMLQCSLEFPDDLRVDWLYDVSFGTGVAPDRWPRLREPGPFCGYSGGIGPATVTDALARIDAPVGAQYWIDMESGVRSDGRFDLHKCAAVCRAVYD